MSGDDTIELEVVVLLVKVVGFEDVAEDVVIVDSVLVTELIVDVWVAMVELEDAMTLLVDIVKLEEVDDDAEVLTVDNVLLEELMLDF